LLVTNADGKVVAGTRPESVGQDLRASPLFEVVGRGQHYESNAGATALVGRNGIVIANPIRADYDSGTIIGALVAIIDWTSLKSMFGPITVTGTPQDDEHRLVVVDTETGNVV